MIMLVSQMVGCLIVAAGIGAIVGWLLRQLSVDRLNQHIYDVTTALQLKEQALHSAQLELKAKASTILTYENKLEASEALARSGQQDVASAAERLRVVQEELDKAGRRIATLESEQTTSYQQHDERENVVAAFEQEVRLANAARTAAQQALSLKEDELIELQNRLNEAEATIAKLDRLKSQLTELEPAQGRVHWLEVQLSEKEVQHRAAMNESEKQRAALAQRVGELEPLQRQLEELRTASAGWESRCHKALKQHATDAGIIDTQRGAIEDLQAALTERDNTLRKQDDQLALLQRQLNELQALYNELASKEQGSSRQTSPEQQARMRDKPVEVRTALRSQAGGDQVIAAQHDPSEDQLSLQIAHSKASTTLQKDDLKKIRGISSVFERALNEMGTHTFIQIAKWTPADITKVAQRLETPADRIKRDNWIAEAKKQHRVKYGERV